MFKIQQYRSGAALPQFHFFILCKGLNSGKPLKKPCPNCFVVTADDADMLNRLYWLQHALYSGRRFYPFLVGSVIPFVRIGVIKELLTLAYNSSAAGVKEINAHIGALQQLEALEESTRTRLAAIKEMRVLLSNKLLM